MKLEFFSPAPRPWNEEARMEAVRASKALDISDSPRLQEIVEEAAALFDAPIAAVSIVDAHRQYFAASLGLDVTETSRTIAFCAHAILDPDTVFEVPDATEDRRFSGNPLVTGPLNLHFYAGAPLIDANGQPLGALCAIDSKPHGHLTEEERTALKGLAREAVAEIERLAGHL